MTLSVPLILLASYLIGAFPTAWLVGRRYGVNLRQAGDGNLGGLNTYRVLGWKPALVVGIVDISKGTLSAWLADEFATGAALPYFATLLAALGHDFSIFARFQGGQGMGSILGALLCLLLFRNWDAAWVVGMVTIIVMVGILSHAIWKMGLVTLLIVTIGIKKWIDMPLARRLRERNP
jgi:acyl-phosphate glycerol 3-phosphate acyltransferase